MIDFVNDNNLYYEHLTSLDLDLPIKTFTLYNDVNSKGCHFHWHEAIEFYHVIEGGLTLNVDGQEHRLSRGDIGYVGWGKPHRGSEFMDGTKHNIIQINLKQLQYFNEYPALTTPSNLIIPFIINDRTLFQYLQKIMIEYESKEIGYKLEIIAAFMKVFSHLLRYHKKNNEYYTTTKNINLLGYVYSILNYINKNYKGKITLEKLANEIGLSKAYLCRLFKSHTNHTITSHINERKCHYAASLILDGLSLQEVCYCVGYNDYNYFSRVFKKVMGILPSQLKV